MKKLFKKVVGYAALALLALSPALTANATKTIYCDKSGDLTKNWSGVCAYVWADNVTASMVTGTKVTGSDNIYKYSIPDNCTKVIFKADNSTSTWSGGQSEDLSFTAGTCYKYSAKSTKTTATCDGTFKWYMLGDAVGGWTLSSNGKAFTNSGSNWTLSYTIPASKDFKMVRVLGTETVYMKYGSGTSNTECQTGMDAQLYNVNGNMYTLSALDCTMTIYLSGSNWKMKTESNAVTPTCPDALYIIGDATSTSWSNAALAMTKSGTTFTADVTVTAETGYLGFTKTSGATSADYGLSGSTATNFSDGCTNQALASSSQSFSLSKGTYTISVSFADAANPTMTITKTTVTPTYTTVYLDKSGTFTTTWSAPYINVWSSSDSSQNTSVAGVATDYPNVFKFTFDSSYNSGLFMSDVNYSQQTDDIASLTADKVYKFTAKGTYTTYDLGSATTTPDDSWYIWGSTSDLGLSGSNWTLTSANMFTQNNDGSYSLTKAIASNAKFQIVHKESGNTTTYSFGGDGRDSSDYWINQTAYDENIDSNSGRAMIEKNGGDTYIMRIYQDGTQWKMKMVIDGPDNMYLMGDFTTGQWTQSSATKMNKLQDANHDYFTIDIAGVAAGNHYFRFVDATSGGNQYHPENDQTAVSVDGTGVTYNTSSSTSNSWKFNLTEASDVTIVFDYGAHQVRVYATTGETVYYFVGDENKWMNDGTYETIIIGTGNKIEIEYGYDVATHGDKKTWAFKKSTNTTSFLASDGWYEFNFADNTYAAGRLWGQFTIFKGYFKEAVKEENRVNADGDRVNWYDKPFTQWSHTINRTTSTAAYCAAPLDRQATASAAASNLFDVTSSNNSNVHLAHNMFTNAILFFNPKTNKIALVADGERDFYVYYANAQDYADNKNVNASINYESMNTVNYTIDMSGMNPDMTLVDSSIEAPNGITYAHYWKVKIPNSCEFPAGQLYTISLANASAVDANGWSECRLDDIWFLDNVKAFAKVDEAVSSKIEKISYRIYGRSKDGSKMVVLDGNTEIEVDPSDTTQGWVEFDAKGTLNNVAGTGTDWSGTESTTGSHYWHKTNTISAANAFKFIQWKIEYNVAQSAPGLRTATLSTLVTPSTFTEDRSDLEAEWVLKGAHKVTTVGIYTGIEGIFGDDVDAEPEYYNLQGIRVLNPENGIFIKKTGNKSEKVMF